MALRKCVYLLVLIIFPTVAYCQVQFLGAAKIFAHQPLFSILPDRMAVEAPMLAVNNKINIFYTDLGNHNIYSVFFGMKYFGVPLIKRVPLIKNAYFPHIFTYKNKAFMLINREGDIYLFERLNPYPDIPFFDQEFWVKANRGAPILTHSQDRRSQWFNIWNVSIAADNQGVFHLLAECAPGGINQKGVGLCYSFAKISHDKINFNPNRSTYAVIPAAGNPDILFIPQNNVLLVFHGVLYKKTSVFGKNYWYIGASYAYLSSNLCNASSWHNGDNDFLVGENKIHVADPHLINVSNNKILFNFSYNQNRVYFVYANTTSEKLFDSIKNGAA